MKSGGSQHSRAEMKAQVQSAVVIVMGGFDYARNRIQRISLENLIPKARNTATPAPTTAAGNQTCDQIAVRGTDELQPVTSVKAQVTAHSIETSHEDFCGGDNTTEASLVRTRKVKVSWR
jgi:hypothetical protein